MLLYHVAAANVAASDLVDGQMIEMVNGESVTIGIADGVVSVNTAEVVIPDVMASNGVAHVVDAVLTPSFLDTSIVDLALVATSTLADLVVAAGLDGALAAADGSYTVSNRVDPSVVN